MAVWRSKPFAPVVIISNDVCAIDSAIRDVIDAVRDFEAEASWHLKVSQRGGGSTKFRNWREESVFRKQSLLPANFEIS